MSQSINPQALCALLRSGSVYDLSQPTSARMPVHPRHPPFLLSMLRRHGDTHRDGGYSAANELLVMCGHHGTHMDALGHVSMGGMLHGGVDAAEAQGGGEGLRSADIASALPIVTRGLLVDVAGHRGVDHLPAGSEIVLSEVLDILEAAKVMPQVGDVYLFRSGWGSLWDQPELYYSADGCPQPGPSEEVARWLSAQQARAAGSDTMAFEMVVQGQNSMPAHSVLLFESGIHIIENLWLEELAKSGISEFLFVASPLRIRGATGSPMRPIAVT